MGCFCDNCMKSAQLATISYTQNADELSGDISTKFSVWKNWQQTEKAMPPKKKASLLIGQRGFEPPTPWSRTKCASPCATARSRITAVKYIGRLFECQGKFRASVQCLKIIMTQTAKSKVIGF